MSIFQRSGFLSHLFSSSSLAMLFSTMIGVIAGIYLTNYIDKRQLIKDKNVAMEMVLKEVKGNEVDLRSYFEEQKKKYSGLTYISPFLDIEEEQIIIPKDSLESFKVRAKDVFTLASIDPIDKNRLELRGDLEIFLDPGSAVLFSGLSSVVWESYKRKNFLQVTKLSCISNLEELYKFQEIFEIDNRALVKGILEGEMVHDVSGFLRQWNIFLLKQKTLLEMFEASDQVLQDCG